MARMRTLFAAVVALGLLVIVPGRALADVPDACHWHLHTDSSIPLTATVIETCANSAWDYVDDASLVGPATVSFYSGPATEWTKTVTVLVAGEYTLSVTITKQTMAGPITGTTILPGTVTVYGAEDTATPTPAPVATPSLTPTRVPTQQATPLPVVDPTSQPVGTPKNLTPVPAAISTASDTPGQSPPASASDSVVLSQSTSPPPSPSATLTASAFPTAATATPATAPLTDPATPTGVYGAQVPIPAFAVAAALALMFVLVVLLFRRHKRRHWSESASDTWW